jgi:hypothetical protein
MRFQKYRNQKVQHDGHSFASKLEAAVYQLLKIREKAGEIEIVNHQDHVYLTQARINYIPDFRIFDHKLDDFVIMAQDIYKFIGALKKEFSWMRQLPSKRQS